MQLVFSQPFSTSKGNEVPLQAWNLTEGSRKLKFLEFMITAQDGGKHLRTGLIYPRICI